MMRLPVFVLFWLALCATGQAYTVDYLFKERSRVVGRFEGLTFPPIEQVLTDQHRDDYVMHRDLGHCGYASFLLYDSYFSRLPGVEKKRKITRWDWALVVQPRHYPELGFCEATETITSNLTKIREAKLEPRPLRQRGIWTDLQVPRDPRDRVTIHLIDMIALALEDFVPAQVKLAELSEDGTIIRLTPAFAYVMLSRAKASGHRHERLGALLADATAALSDKGRRALRPLIDGGEWPRDWPIVRD